MEGYDDDYPTCADTFATLRFYHEACTPDAVTEALGISPSRTQAKGQNTVNGKQVQRRVSGWFLCSRDEVQSKDIRRHIDWILDQVSELRNEFVRLNQEGWRSDISCYWLSHGHGGRHRQQSSMIQMMESRRVPKGQRSTPQRDY